MTKDKGIRKNNNKKPKTPRYLFTYIYQYTSGVSIDLYDRGTRTLACIQGVSTPARTQSRIKDFPLFLSGEFLKVVSGVDRKSFCLCSYFKEHYEKATHFYFLFWLLFTPRQTFRRHRRQLCNSSECGGQSAVWALNEQKCPVVKGWGRLWVRSSSLAI